MNQNYKEMNIHKSLYRGGSESFAERLEKLDPTENYRGTELGSLDAFQRQLKRFDIQVGGSQHHRKVLPERPKRRAVPRISDACRPPGNGGK